MADLSLEQAYKVMQVHLSESGGLMDQVERGFAIDNEQIKALDEAIKRIQHEWRSLIVVPKKCIQLLYDIFPRLEKCIQKYPQREGEITHLYSKFASWIDAIFAEEPLSEEAAIAIVHQQIEGLQPFGLELRFGQGLNEISLDLFYSALEKLAEAWKSKESISKLAAGSLINAQDLFISFSDLYSDIEQQKMQKTKEQIRTRIDQCFI